jgi:hypothetical protein
MGINHFPMIKYVKVIYICNSIIYNYFIKTGNGGKIMVSRRFISVLVAVILALGMATTSLASVTENPANASDIALNLNKNLAGKVSTQAVSPGDTVAAKPRVVVDGNINNLDGYLINNDYYFIPQDIEHIMLGSSKLFKASAYGKTITAGSVKVKGVIYISLRDVAKAMNFFYTYDNILDAVYIWTDLWYDEDAQIVEQELERGKKLGIGTVPANNPNITYVQLFKMLDRTVELIDSSKLKKWKVKLTAARKSNQVVTRYNAMMVIMNAAETLGGDYLTWNTDWNALHDLIGEPWDDCVLDTRFFDGLRHIKISGSDWQYDAGAYFYSMGRASLLTNKTLFDYDLKKNSMRPNEKLTYKTSRVKTCRNRYGTIVKGGYI